MKKIKLFLVFGIFLISGLFIFRAEIVSAANCGGATQCDCGDTVTTPYVLSQNLSCTEGVGLRVQANLTLSADISVNDNIALIVESEDVTIEGNNHLIQNVGARLAGEILGIVISNQDIVVQNLTIQNFISGVEIGMYQGGLELTNSNTLVQNVVFDQNGVGVRIAIWGGNTIKNCTFTYNAAGAISLESDNNTVLDNTLKYSSGGYTAGYSYSYAAAGLIIAGNNNQIGSEGHGNVIDSNSIAIYIPNPVSGNVVSHNKILRNNEDIIGSIGTNVFTENQFIDNNKNRMLSWDEFDRIKNLEDTVTFVYQMSTLSGVACPSCSNTLLVSPDETVNSSASDNEITAVLTPQRQGSYSLQFSVADSNQNITRRNVSFIVGDSSSRTEKHYFSNENPISGQPYSIPGTNDARSLVKTAPLQIEYVDCGVWIQVSPKEIPTYPSSVLSSVHAGTWYKVGGESAPDMSVGITRYTGYDDPAWFNTSLDIMDRSALLPSALDFTWNDSIEFTNINWAMDYQRSWYWFGYKFYGGNGVYWVSYPNPSESDQPSYLDFTYSYSTSPAVKTISEESINLLSATALADPSNVELSLRNWNNASLSTDIVLDKWNTDKTRPFLNATKTTVVSTGATATVTASVNADSIKTLTSVPLDITPNAGSIDVAITTWNDSGDYSKEWTETGTGVTSAEHTVGNLQAGTYYMLAVDGTDVDVYLADESGNITFNYTGGYSAHTFTITEAATTTQITAFTISNQPDPVINQTTRTIVFTMPYNTNITSFSPTITVSPGATVSPASGVAQDFTNPVSYTVTAEDGVTTQTYAVTVTVSGSSGSVGRSAPTQQPQLTPIQTLQAEVARLMKLIAELSGKPTSPTTPTPTSFQFTKVLQLGDNDPQVKQLQQFLNAKGFTVSQSGPGSQGNETTMFGHATRNALIKFQEAHADQILKPLGLTKGTGKFARMTITVANGLGE